MLFDSVLDPPYTLTYVKWDCVQCSSFKLRERLSFNEAFNTWVSSTIRLANKRAWVIILDNEVTVLVKKRHKYILDVFHYRRSIIKVKLSRYMPWRRLGGGGIAPSYTYPRH
jgi:hypothetical protein